MRDVSVEADAPRERIVEVHGVAVTGEPRESLDVLVAYGHSSCRRLAKMRKAHGQSLTAGRHQSPLAEFRSSWNAATALAMTVPVSPVATE